MRQEVKTLQIPHTAHQEHFLNLTGSHTPIKCEHVSAAALHKLVIYYSTKINHSILYLDVNKQSEIIFLVIFFCCLFQFSPLGNVCHT